MQWKQLCRTLGLASVLCGVGWSATAQVAIDTTNLTINGSSTKFNCWPMSVADVGGVARFVVYGDIVINSGSVTIQGYRSLSLHVH